MFVTQIQRKFQFYPNAQESYTNIRHVVEGLVNFLTMTNILSNIQSDVIMVNSEEHFLTYILLLLILTKITV